MSRTIGSPFSLPGAAIESIRSHQSLADYDASAYPAVGVTVDIVVLTIRQGQLCVLLIRRGEQDRPARRLGRERHLRHELGPLERLLKPLIVRKARASVLEAMDYGRDSGLDQFHHPLVLQASGCVCASVWHQHH